MWNKVIDDWKTPVEYIDREAANLALAEQGFDWDKAKSRLLRACLPQMLSQWCAVKIVRTRRTSVAA